MRRIALHMQHAALRPALCLALALLPVDAIIVLQTQATGQRYP